MYMVHLITSSTPFSRRGNLDPLGAVHLALGAADIDTAWGEMADRLAEAGFETCAFVHANRTDRAPIKKTGANYWGRGGAAEMLDLLCARPDLQSISHTIQVMRRSSKPLVKFGDTILPKGTTSKHAEYRKLFSSFGLQACAGIPFNTPGQDMITVAAWFDDRPIEEAQKHWQRYGRDFTLTTAFFAEAVRDIHVADSAGAEELSARERECLLWVAAGRRTGEIADILCLSEATVNEYLSRSMKKLGATTRSQACAKAIMSGVLAP